MGSQFVRVTNLCLLRYLPSLVAGCLVSAYFFAPPAGYTEQLMSLLLFSGLLTLVNAPFDWVSIGLTRALLRRGLELGGWWPILLALSDAVIVAIIIALLSLTTVIAVQAFDDLEALGGGGSILPLAPLLDGLAAHPTEPEYWWVYALLL